MITKEPDWSTPRKVSILVAAERVFGAVFGVPGAFGSGFAVVFGSVRRQTNFLFSARLKACSRVRQASKVSINPRRAAEWGDMPRKAARPLYLSLFLSLSLSLSLPMWEG